MESNVSTAPLRIYYESVHLKPKPLFSPESGRNPKEDADRLDLPDTHIFNQIFVNKTLGE